MMPGGKYAAADLDKAGGTPLIAKRMLEGGYLSGDQISPSGQTIAAEAAFAVETPGQDVVRTLDNPVNDHGGLIILKGNIAPDGGVIKFFGYERTTQGPRSSLRLRERRASGRLRTRSTPATSL